MKYIQVENAQTKQVTKHETSWTDFVHHLFDHSRIESTPPQKTQTPAFASCILSDGCSRRLKTNVVRMSSFIAFDLDHHFYAEELVTAMQGIEFVAYNTTNATIDDKRWRLVVRLADEYDPQHHLLLWHFFDDLLTRKLFWGLDQNTKDTTRLSFYPRNWKNSHGEIFHNAGFAFDVAELVASGFTAPQPVQTAVQPHIYLLSENVPPPNDPVFTPPMLAKFLGAPRGGRYFKLMVRAAIRYRVNDWFLSAADLVNATQAHKHILGSRNANHEAKNAITYVETNWSTIQANIEAKQAQKQVENEAAMQEALKRWGLK